MFLTYQMTFGPSLNFDLIFFEDELPDLVSIGSSVGTFINMLFGCYIWVNVLQYNFCRFKLRAVQRLSCILGTRFFPTVSFYCPLTLSNLFPIEIRAIELATYLAIKLNFPSISHPSIINHVLSSCSLRRYHVDTPVKSYFSSYLHSSLVSSLRPNLMGYYTVIV